MYKRNSFEISYVITAKMKAVLLFNLIMNMMPYITCNSDVK